ncbi:uncharacterized protein LOC143265792 [Megachile rotundata]|uniref:uncharacterized protein LOC143265792 n=1 Tax=Megachile rotundata TaxID=143995 RepID=UPI003FD4F579
MSESEGEEKSVTELDEDDDDDLSDLTIHSRHSVLHMDYRYKLTILINTFWATENNRYLEDKLLNFLILDLYGVMDFERKVIFFYATYTTEVHQEEIDVWERKIEKTPRKPRKSRKRTKKGKRDTKLDPLALLKQLEMSMMTLQSSKESSKVTVSESETEAGDEEEEDEEEEGEEEGEDEGGTRELGSGEPSTFSLRKDDSRSTASVSVSFVPPPGEEDKYILTKKMVERVKKVPALHMICGELDGSRTDLHDVTLFYFLRTHDEGIPPFDSYEECNDEIAKYLVVGSLQGRYLLSMNRILLQVFKPLVESQFRGPQFVELVKDEHSEDDDLHHLADILQSRSSILRRPSEFRRASMVLARKFSERKSQKDVHEDEETSVTPVPSQISSEPIRPSKARLKRSDIKVSTVTFEERLSKVEVKPPAHDGERRSSIDQSKHDVLTYLDKLVSSVEWLASHLVLNSYIN